MGCFVGDTTLPADQSYTYLNVDDAKDLRYRKVTLTFTTVRLHVKLSCEIKPILNLDVAGSCLLTIMSCYLVLLVTVID